MQQDRIGKFDCDFMSFLKVFQRDILNKIHYKMETQSPISARKKF